MINISTCSPHADGVTSDNTAFALAVVANKQIRFTSGRFLVGEDFSFTVPVSMGWGACFVVPNGVTLTFCAGFDATFARSFECYGTGRVVFLASSAPIGKPEWWGAVPNNPAHDCAPGVNASLEACHITELQAAGYFGGPLRMRRPHRTLRGQGTSWTAGGGSQYYCTNGSDHILDIGPDAVPATLNEHMQKPRVQNLTLDRYWETPIVPSSGCQGLRLQYTMHAEIDHVESFNSMVSFYISGNVHDEFTKCYAMRNLAGTTTAGDSFQGFLCNGWSGIPAAGGNASNYLTRCGAACDMDLPANILLHLDGAPADTFVDGFEGTRCKTGIHVKGSIGTAKARYGDIDVRITNCVIDAFKENGYVFENISHDGAITFKGNYAAPMGGTGRDSCVKTVNCHGTIHSSDNQLIGGPAEVHGLNLENTTKYVTSDIIKDCKYPVTLTDSHSCKITPSIDNRHQGVSGVGAVDLLGSTRNVIAPTVDGDTEYISFGVRVDTFSNYNDINVSGISATAAQNKVSIHGVATYSAPGTYSTNKVDGVFA